MNLPEPPKTGNRELDEWLISLYEYLKFPAFHAVRFVPRTAPIGDAAVEGVVYHNDAGNVLKAHNGTDFQDCY